MNNKIFYIFIFIISISISSMVAQNRADNSDTLSMYPGYSNDIFYSMTDGAVSNIPRGGWEIAFYTSAFSAGIIINEGNGVELYTYPNGDTSVWDNIDTTGLHTWNKLYNSPEYWEDGAFNRNATGHPDYGWGVYNMVTHSLIGDSIYLINIPQVGLKKLWIVDKISVNNIYHIKYADLDGLNEISSEIDVKPYIAKNFIYFSLTSNEVIDREPSENWELLFTRYIDFTFDNTGTPVEYLVAGATSNIDQYANKFYPVANDYEDWSAKPFDSLKNVVGYNWKNFSMATFEWVVEDSTAFFIMNDAGDVYKLVFTLWEGSSTGVFAFNKELISLSFIGNDTKKQHFVSIYPNPASEFVNININNEILFDGKIIMTDLSGRIVYNSTISNSVGNTSVAININDFTKGIYFITLQSNDTRETHKLVVQ